MQDVLRLILLLPFRLCRMALGTGNVLSNRETLHNNFCYSMHTGMILRANLHSDTIGFPDSMSTLGQRWNKVSLP